MAAAYIPSALREFVRERARYRCEYCHTTEWVSGLPCEIDHIIPLAGGGETTAVNLCLACSACNSYKQAKTDHSDPESGETVSLFNPRKQNWPDHFAWNESQTHLKGLIPCGRATIAALQMNNRFIVVARSLWVKADLHPPVA